MPLFAAGISHHHVSADVIGALGQRNSEIVSRLRAAEGVRGVVSLATCNRYELYLDMDGFHAAVGQAAAAIGSAAGELAGLVQDSLVIYADQGVVEHLFEVASGLDSMVVGEVEIIGQVRESLAEADEHLSPVLRRLFQHALTTSKAVTSHTDLGTAGRSLASIGLDLAEGRIPDWSAAKVLVVGTGNYARVVLADLARRGCRSIQIHSRSGQGEGFAAAHDVAEVGADDLPAAVATADLVACCSGNGEPLLTAESLTATGRRNLLPLVDLSAGTDVAKDVEGLAWVDLITLDRIGAVAPVEYTAALLQARDLVTRAVTAYLHVEEGRTAAPAVTAIRSHVSRIIEQEITDAAARHSPETAEAIARSLRRVSNSLLHAPSVRAAELARTGGLEDYSRALHTLFGIEVDVP